MDGVAARAQLGAFHVLTVLWHHAGRVGHRLLLGLGERSVDFAGRAEQEIAGECPRQSAEARIGPLLPRSDASILRQRLRSGGGGLAEHHAVAGGAGDAVARQCRIMRERANVTIRLERNGIQMVARKRLAGAGGGMAVGGEAGAGLARRGSRGRCPRSLAEDSGWKVSVSLASCAKKIGSRPARPFGGRAPGPIRRQVHHLVVRTRLRHVELQSGAAGAVAAEALRRRHQLRSGVRLAGGRPDMVVGFRWHFDDGLARRPRLAQEPEEAREERRVGRLRRCFGLGLRLRNRLVKALK